MSDLISFVAGVIGDLLSRFFLGPIFFWIGWPFAKLLSLGRYPRHSWQESSRESVMVSCLGVVIFALLLMLLFGQLSTD
ncbi:MULTISPECIES: hypothetical protein [Pseudomonas]|uniref:hypothetical protein n=1 Tax=Pseudomonas TaxID=286 RepID=UPI000563B711|nr:MULTISPECIES: hypothetical protein [Pseudomonas]UUT22120.1 hypothetical protein NRG23_31270 [Pseudomonas sp. T8]